MVPRVRAHRRRDSGLAKSAAAPAQQDRCGTPPQVDQARRGTKMMRIRPHLVSIYMFSIPIGRPSSALCARTPDASGTAMPRFFAVMMICVMLLSHGTASIAAPHGAGSTIEHTHHAEHAVADVVDRHDADESGAADKGSEKDIAHSHASADQARNGVLLPTRLKIRDVLDSPTHHSPLTPIQSAPLLEPPTA